MKKILLLLLVMLSGCSTSNVYLGIQGAAWRKYEAFSAPQFAVGVIETSGRNRFDPKGSIKVSDFPIVAQTTIYSAETAQAAIEAEGKMKPGTVDLNGRYKTEIENRQYGTYVIFRTLEPYTLVKIMNAPENRTIMEQLKAESRQPVIITGTAVSYRNISNSKIHQSLEGNASISIGVVDTPSVRLGVENSSEKSTVLSDGTVFAYEYSVIQWDSSVAYARVKGLEIDRPANPWF
ncbi:hypothetical protein HKK52_00940 [Pseudomonas sp. ADAK2]|uniref:hypothetical protein n=1 Tax=Pseudomonas TaxID=286 RepID=UPI001462F1C8|nr:MULTISPECIES: hypothetical protein [unclassified Pseudomonas]QJI39541.1 hypothetical protein HKK53_00940 [Pseudomonas sp. ADAK7]QJI45847.1 hypothetical protein HKK52_00940 [Pseudomonas sp. ADAK2]